MTTSLDKNIARMLVRKIFGNPKSAEEEWEELVNRGVERVRRYIDDQNRRALDIDNDTEN